MAKPKPRPVAWARRNGVPGQVDVTVGRIEYRGMTEHAARELAKREGWDLKWVPSL